MFGQFVAVLQLTGLFTVCIAAYWVALQSLMPNSARLTPVVRRK